MADLPLPLTYGTVTGFAGFPLADSSDPGDRPDWETASGTVTFKPDVNVMRLSPTGEPTRFALAKLIVCRLVNGALVAPDGATTVRLLATNSPGLNPVTFNWIATIAVQGAAINPPPLLFQLPSGTTVNLADIVSLSPQTNVVEVVTEQTRIAAQAAAAAAAASAELAAEWAQTLLTMSFDGGDPSTVFEPGAFSLDGGGEG